MHVIYNFYNLVKGDVMLIMLQTLLVPVTDYLSTKRSPYKDILM